MDRTMDAVVNIALLVMAFVGAYDTIDYGRTNGWPEFLSLAVAVGVSVLFLSGLRRT